MSAPCPADPAECAKATSYTFAVYDRDTVPAGVRRALNREFAARSASPQGICRGGISSQYLTDALPAADLLAVGMHGGRVAAIILILRPSFVSPVTGRAVCKAHEWYLDVVCSYYCHRHCGAETIRRLLAYAAARGVRAVRIYATLASRDIWRERWGFREAETIVRRKTRLCQYGPEETKHYPKERRGSQTYRMTRVLLPRPLPKKRTR